MHIIIEGLDKTGKSTLSRFLAEKTGMPIKKFNNPKPGEDAAVEYAEFIVTAQSCIVDRMHLSEMAYGPVFRGKSTVDVNVQRVIEGLAKRRGVVGIYCYADVDDLEKRFTEDGEDFVMSTQIPEIAAGFDRALATSTMEWIRYSVGDNMEAIYDKVR